MFSSFMKSYYASLCDARNAKNKYVPYRKLLLTQYHKEKYVRGAVKNHLDLARKKAILAFKIIVFREHNM